MSRLFFRNRSLPPPPCDIAIILREGQLAQDFLFEPGFPDSAMTTSCHPVMGATSSGAHNGGQDSFVQPWSASLSLYCQASSPLGATTSQDFPAILRAHPFTESMLAFFLEVRWLLRCKRHASAPCLRYPQMTTGHYRGGLIPCQTACARF